MGDAPSKNRTKRTLDLRKHIMRACPDDYVVEITIKYGSRVVSYEEFPSLALSIARDDEEQKQTLRYACMVSTAKCIKELFPS